jgi:hypothetical protein
MTLDTIIIIPDTIFVQEVDDEIVLLDSNTQEYFTLNEVGAIFWQVLQDNPKLTQAYSILKDHFEDAKTLQLEEDLLAFVEALVEKRLITTKGLI